MEDSSALLVTAESPLAQLQRQRLLARLAAASMGRACGRIVRARVGTGPALAAALAGAGGRWPGSRPACRMARKPPTGRRRPQKAPMPACRNCWSPRRRRAYTGAARTSWRAARPQPARRQTVVEWCLKNPEAGETTLELSDGQVLKAGDKCARWTATESLFWRWRGARYTLKVTPDAAPEITSRSRRR
jgi:hypothetical protein